MNKALFTLFAALVSACTGFTPLPDRDRDAALPKAEQFTATQTGATRELGSLLDLFEDIKVRKIVTKALDNNLDLRAAALRLEQAGYTAGITHAARLPQAALGVGNSRSRDSGAIANTARASLDVNWEVDLWGRLGATHNAVRADGQAAAAQFEAARASIAAQTMQAWFEYNRTRKVTQLERQRLASLKQQKELIGRNYRAGVGRLDDLAAIERDVALSNEVVLTNKATQNNAARTLEILLGEYPDAVLQEKPGLPRLPPPPKAGVPANVLAQRPDMRAAWQAVLAADRRVEAAQKEMLPRISLTGSLGRRSADFSNLVSGATIWTLAQNLSAPIFDGGRRRAEVLASRNRADQAWVAYLQTALRAYSEVERALEQEQLLRQREAALRKALQHAETTADLFETRYHSGLVSVIDLLASQNTVYNIETQLLSLRTARLNNRVALALALGKGV